MHANLSRTIGRAFTLSLVLGAALTGAATAGSVEVTIQRIQAGKGPVLVSLCTADEFLRKCALRTSLEATAESGRVTIPDVPPGRYAIMAAQDLDADGKVKRGLFGEPLEPTGMSRDARGSMGPPAFEDAAFDVGAEPVAHTVTLN